MSLFLLIVYLRIKSLVMVQQQPQVLNHPAGLFVLFFTEMWERFSYYGMRGLLVIFLVSTFDKGGWEWTTEKALGLYGTYTMMAYITPMMGGILADKWLGYRKAILVGAFFMTLGHAAMAFETEITLYTGLVLLVIGNGFFKPNMTSIIGQLYEKTPEKKDGAFAIFHMGINAGAFLGILLCGYIGEQISWGLGFGLAGIFMFFGLIQFYFTQDIFENIGLKPPKEKIIEAEEIPKNILFDRLIVLSIICLFSVFFFAAFEQAGGAMTIFAKNNTQRILTGSSGVIFKYIDAAITISSLLLITYVLYLLMKQTFKKYTVGNTVLGVSFLIIWGIVIWKTNREFSSIETEIPASWFGVLNSLFIIFFAPLFSKLWESKYNFAAPFKFGLGFLLLGLGFGFLAYGALPITENNPMIKVSVIWLILAYLFHTLGELCLYPVSLSYVTKLVPMKWMGIAFGIYLFSLAMGNKAAAIFGSKIDQITAEYSLSEFFLALTIIPILLGITISAMHPLIKKLMHGIN